MPFAIFIFVHHHLETVTYADTAYQKYLILQFHFFITLKYKVTYNQRCHEAIYRFCLREDIATQLKKQGTMAISNSTI